MPWCFGAPKKSPRSPLCRGVANIPSSRSFVGNLNPGLAFPGGIWPYRIDAGGERKPRGRGLVVLAAARSTRRPSVPARRTLLLKHTPCFSSTPPIFKRPAACRRGLPPRQKNRTVVRFFCVGGREARHAQPHHCPRISPPKLSPICPMHSMSNRKFEFRIEN